MTWTSIFPVEELPQGSISVFKQDEHQIAVVHTQAGDIYAIDNRCPHEGYPLAQGTVSGCVLTCNWHNYKFDLRDGSCVMGEEAVRSYPARIANNQVQVDLSPPDIEKVKQDLWKSMDEGMSENQLGRVARDAVRLLEKGVDASAIAVYAARWDAKYAKYGSTHALPIAADILHWLPSYPAAMAVIPLIQALDVAARPNIRRPPRVRPEPKDPGPTAEQAHQAFVQAVESEDTIQAEALIRGAIDKGWGSDVYRVWLLDAVGAHFLDFGHQLIYLIKLLELMERTGEAHADELVGSYVFGLVNGTREDLLPDWGTLNIHLSSIEGDIEHLFEASTTHADPSWSDADALKAAILDGKRRDVFAAVTAALRQHAPLEALAGILSEAAGERMLRFDPAIDLDPSVQDSWLNVTHIQTYMAALRQSVVRYPQPACIRLLFFGAFFCNKARGLDHDQSWRVEPWSTHEGLEALLATIHNKQRTEALARLLAWHESGEDMEPLKTAVMDVCVKDPVTRPIVIAHIMKNTIVAFEEYDALQSPVPLLALVALLTSPLKERRIHRVTTLCRVGNRSGPVCPCHPHSPASSRPMSSRPLLSGPACERDDCHDQRSARKCRRVTLPGSPGD